MIRKFLQKAMVRHVCVHFACSKQNFFSNIANFCEKDKCICKHFFSNAKVYIRFLENFSTASL